MPSNGSDTLNVCFFTCTRVLGHGTGLAMESHEQHGNCLTDPAMTPYFKQYRYDTHRDEDTVTLTNQRVASVIANKPFFFFWRDGGYFWLVASTGSAWLWPAGGGTVGLKYWRWNFLFYFTKEIAW